MAIVQHIGSPQTPIAAAVPRRRRRLFANWKLATGTGLILAVILFSLLGPLFYDTSLAYVGSSPPNLPPMWMERGLTEHPLGTENMGRDMVAQLIVGTPNSLRVGLIAASLGLGTGLILGSLAGYLGGSVDTVIRTLSDSVVTIPSLIVLIVIASYVHMTDTTVMALILALFAWPGPTRVVRAQVLSLRERGFVRMALLSCAPPAEIMFVEMLPNMLPWLAAAFTGGVSGAVLGATGLEILGLGPTRVPSLGTIIYFATNASALLRGLVWWWLPPILILMLIFASLFLVAMGLDEIANPRLREVKS